MAEEITFYRVVPVNSQQRYELRHWQGWGDSTQYPTWSTRHFATEEQILKTIGENFPGWRIETRKQIVTDWEEKR